MPDEGPEEDSDSSEVRSREPSVQIMDRQPRTFSVPSSDDGLDSDDFELEELTCTRAQGIEEKGSSPTAHSCKAGPRQKLVTRYLVEAPSIRLHRGGPELANIDKTKLNKISQVEGSVGASQLNPIEVEDESGRMEEIISSDSEDEGPDILPINQPNRPPSSDNHFNEEPEATTRIHEHSLYTGQNQSHLPEVSLSRGLELFRAISGYPTIENIHDQDSAITFVKVTNKEEATLAKENLQNENVGIQEPGIPAADRVQTGHNNSGPATAEKVSPLSTEPLMFGHSSQTSSYIEERDDRHVVSDSDVDDPEADIDPYDSEFEQDEETGAEDMDNISLETPLRKLDSESTDQYDSTDDDDDFADEFFSHRHDRPRGTSTDSELRIFPHTTLELDENLNSAEYAVMVKESQHHDSFMEAMNGSNGFLDVSRPDSLNDIALPIQRAPSPSDAALAKKPVSTQLERIKSQTSSLNNSMSSRDYYSTLAIDQNGALRARGLASTPAALPQIFGIPIPSDAYSQAHSLENLPDSDIPRYEDGPFAVRLKPDEISHVSPKLHQQQSAPSASAIRECIFYSQHRQIQRPTSVIGNPNVTEDSPVPDTSAVGAETVSDCVSLQAPERGSASKPSKVNISDLVNPHADTTRVLKRKASAMSTIGEHDILFPTSSQVPCAQENSQDSVLPDAQARGEIMLPNVSQDSPYNSMIATAQSIDSAMVSEVQGPAKKRVKTTAKTSRGVGRFISGVIVGVAGGVAGAFAAFVATIPLSVRDEALRELGYNA